MNKKLIAKLTTPVIPLLLSVSNISAQSTFKAGDILNPAIPRGGLDSSGKPQHGVALGDYIAIFWQTAIIISGLAFFVYLLYGGFRYLTAGGDQKATGEARNIIMHALIGLMIIAASAVVLKIVESVTGITIISGPLRFPIP